MNESIIKYPPSHSMTVYWAASTGCFLFAHLAMIIWGTGLKDYVDQQTQDQIGLGLTIALIATMLLAVRDAIPMVSLFITNLHYDVFVMPREHKAEMERIEQEWREKIHTPTLPRKKKLKPVGEPINLRQWIGQRNHFGGGYVYLLKDIEITGYCKIGKTTQPFHRMKAFGVQLPFETELIHVIECRNLHQTETQLHTRFADKRKRGEWFDLTTEDIEWLKLHNAA